jgi:hypothetical protein
MKVRIVLSLQEIVQDMCREVLRYNPKDLPYSKWSSFGFRIQHTPTEYGEETSLWVVSPSQAGDKNAGMLVCDRAKVMDIDQLGLLIADLYAFLTFLEKGHWVREAV